MTNNSSYPLVKPILYLSGYTIISFLGLIVNIIAIWLFFFVKKLRSPTIVYMKNLAITDLLLVCTLPLKIYSYAVSASNISPKALFWMCNVTGSFLLLNMYGSIFLLTCISFDRYLAVCFPIRSRHFRQRASWICAAVWFLNIISGSAHYIVAVPKNDSYSSCTDNQHPYVTQRGPAIGAIGFGFLVPLAVIVISSVSMLRSMKQSQVVQEGIVNKVKVIRMLGTNITIFLLCFLPYHMILFLYQFENNSTLGEAYNVTLLIACFNTVLDPFTYYFTTETIKNVVKEEFKAGKKFLELSDQSYEKNRPIISS
ncbi:lysophosphatidic acid receptor 4-like [Leptodactylus fuscus]|uniref:lysophosphatidic acid receptor 4-like n=1 Tax=Leptodactylus fuscus TaxID=238119 RepID=UPI003F4EC2F2